MDCSPLGSSVHGILQARVLEWVAISSSGGGGGSSQPRDQTCVCLAGGFFTTEPPGSPDFHWEDGKFLWVDGYTALRIFNTMDLYKKRVNFIVYIIKIFLNSKKKKKVNLYL